MKLRRALAKLAGDRPREPESPPAPPTEPSTDEPDTDFAAHGSADGPPRDLSITFTLVDRPRDES